MWAVPSSMSPIKASSLSTYTSDRESMIMAAEEKKKVLFFPRFEAYDFKHCLKNHNAGATRKSV